MYFDDVKRVKDMFKDVLVLTMDSFSDPGAVFRKVCEFAGVPPDNLAEAETLLSAVNASSRDAEEGAKVRELLQAFLRKIDANSPRSWRSSFYLSSLQRRLARSACKIVFVPPSENAPFWPSSMTCSRSQYISVRSGGVRQLEMATV